MIANVPEGDKADVDLAVAAARRAFDDGAGRRSARRERGKMLWQLADLIERDLEELAELESIDNGKPYAVARVADLPLAVDMFRYMAGWATKITGSTLPLSLPGEYLSYTVREPVGVVGQIIPWNFPLLMAAWKLAPALAAGCTVVLKAAEQTPLTALRLARTDPGGGCSRRAWSTSSPASARPPARRSRRIPMWTRWRSPDRTEVGKLIVQAAAGNLKKVSLELGGKSPAIILPDADLDLAIAGAANAIFFNHGQCCCAGSRLYAHKSVYDKVVAGVADIAGKIKVGPGSRSAAPRWGRWCRTSSSPASPAISRTAGRPGRTYRRRAATGSAISATSLQPTVLENTTPDMKVIREEIFGPVVCATPFDDDDLDGSPSRPTTRSMAWPPACGREWRHGAQAGQPHPLRHGLDQLPQRVRRVAAVRRLQAVRLGPRDGRGSVPQLHRGQGGHRRLYRRRL